MLDFQTIAAIVFLIILAIFLYLKRKNLDTKQIIPHVLYFSMYKTKWGLKLMDSLAKKNRKFTAYVGYAGVLFGFLGMILISYALINNLYVLFTTPEASPGVGLVLPIRAKGIFFVPFFYWIISIFVIAVVHEFSHGLIARAHKIKVKSSGFAFLGLIAPIIPAAFVEPDERELRKRPHKQQLSVFAAGPFSNILVGFLCLAILSFIFAPITNALIEPDGVKITDYVKQDGKEFPAEKAGIKIGEVVQRIDDKPTPFVNNLSAALRGKKPGDVVALKTDKSAYEVTMAKNPDNESMAYIGAYLEQNTKINENIEARFGTLLPNAVIWISGLFAILFILNLGIGLFNLVPIGPLDGGRMLQLVLHRIFDVEKGNKVWYFIGMFFLVIIFINIAFAFVR